MKITGFGDFLIHFSPPGDERFAQAELMSMSFTGAEANVCTALAFWGENTEFVTKLPAHQLAKKGISFLKSFGIKTDNIPEGEGRMGAYYLETGRFLRPSSVIYDRDNSVFTNSVYGDYDWDSIFEDTDIFYVSGITPTLSENLFECTKEALKEANKRGIKVFFDINYRPKLSTPQKSFEIMKELLPYITCLIGNEEHMKMIFGISSGYGDDEPEKRVSDMLEKAKAVTGAENIAITVRRTFSASESGVYAGLSANGETYVAPMIKTGVIDRVGSGDSFSAGLIYAMVHNYDVRKAVSFAVASCALKHTVTKDINFVSVEEITDVMNNSAKDVRR